MIDWFAVAAWGATALFLLWLMAYAHHRSEDDRRSVFSDRGETRREYRKRRQMEAKR